MAEVTPVTLLIGFADAGKTALLHHLLRQTEAAHIGVVTAQPEPPMRWNAGCACCAPRDDVARGLRALLPRARRDEMRRVIIETTGLADAGPILATLLSDPVAASAYRLDGIVTVIDAPNTAAALDPQEKPDAQEKAVRQVAMADRIVLTATGSTEGLRARLRHINPGAPIVQAPDGAVEPAVILNAGLCGPAPDLRAWLAADAFAAPDRPAASKLGDAAANKLAGAVGSFCCTISHPLRWPAISAWLERLVLLHGDSVLRMKAVLHLQDQPGPVAIHSARHLLFPPMPLPAWPAGDTRQSRLALIARGVSCADLGESLARLVTAADVG